MGDSLRLEASSMCQRAATNIESLAHGVQGVAQMLAFAAVREHELCRAHDSPRQRVPAIEVDPALGEHLCWNAVGDEAEVVLDE